MTSGSMAERGRRPVIVLLGALTLAIATVTILVATQPAPRCTKLTRDMIGRKEFRAPPCLFIDKTAIYYALLHTTEGDLRLELNPGLARTTVNNFVFLALTGFYDNTTFHRVENPKDHALIQGGDPTGTGHGGPGYTYRGEEPSPVLSYIRGVVAMANTGSLSSNGSQFFIMAREWKALGAPDHKPTYTFFGFVPEPASFAVLDRIVSVPTKGTKPLTPVVIRSVDISVYRKAIDKSPSPIPRP